MPYMAFWQGLKRPLLLAFIIGCTISFLTSRTLTLRLVLPSMVSWAFVPIIEIAALAVVCWNDRNDIPLPRIIDLFFKGFSPWLLWAFGLCMTWLFLSPGTETLDWAWSVLWVNGGAAVAAAWSLYIDFGFFRSVLKRSPAGAMRELAIQRLVSWSLILSIVGGPTIWSEITGRLW
jgi:hypothetical protein